MKDILVPGLVNLVINDTQIPDDKVKEVFARMQPSAEVLSASELTVELEKNIAVALLGIENLLQITMLFPGYGADALATTFSPQFRNLISPINKYWVEAYRILSGNKPSYVKLEIPAEVTDGIKKGVTKQIWVCDDVIATGLTIQSIKADISSKLDNNYNPDLRFSYPVQGEINLVWRAFCWLQRKDAVTEPFSVQPTVIYGSQNGKRKVPLNSLSTLLSRNIAGLSARLDYSRKFFNGEEDFVKLLSKLRSYE